MIIQLLIGCAFLTSLWLGIIVLKKDYSKKLNLSFAIFSFTISIWSLINFISGFSNYYLFLKLTFGIGAYLPPLATLWISYFIKGDKLTNKYRLSLSVYFLLSILFFILAVFTNAIASGTVEKVLFGPLFYLYSIFLLSAIFIPIYLIVKFYVHTSGVLRLQARYIILGLGSFGSLTLLVSFVLPLFGLQQFGRLDSVSSLFFSLFSSYAIIKHRFLDIRFIVRKSFIFIGLAIFVFLAYYLVLWIDNTFFKGPYTVGAYLSAIIIAPLFLLAFNYFSKYLKKTANQYFFTGLYDYQEVLETFARKISKTIKLEGVVKVIINTIQSAMRVDNMAIALADPSHKHPFLLHTVIGFNKQELENVCEHQTFCHYLQQVKHPVVIDELLSGHEQTKDKNLVSDAKLLKNLGVALVLPFVVKDEINSVAIVGRKVSKDAYTKEDLELLTTLGNQASVAIENARLYQEVQDFNQNLQTKVEAQTKDIKDKTKRLEKLLEIRSEFLDIASHQLRTPVSLIRGVLAMIKEGDLQRLPKEKQQQFIENAWQKGAKLDTIINDILAASELDTQKFQVDEKTPTIQLEEVVDKVIKDSQMEAEKRGIELKWRKPVKPLPKVKGHANFLEQAIANLVGNALKYTPSTKMVKEARSKRETKGVVEVSVYEEKGKVIVKIKDNGIGIPQEEIPKLFDKFVRASNATAMYTDGSGLGLFIVKEIIDGHQGKVWVESELNKGSMFYISLPMV